MCNTFDTVPYDASHTELASAFSCGNRIIDQFLRDSKAFDISYGKTYVWLTDDKSAIIGYYNIGVGYIEQCIDGKYQKIGGSAHINYFALDKKFHRKLIFPSEDAGRNVYIADRLLNDCILRIEEIRKNHIGYSFITLCSTERGHRLYCRNDFCELENDMKFSPDETENQCYLMYFPLDYE